MLLVQPKIVKPETAGRPAVESDLSDIATIYNHEVANSTATFDLEASDHVLLSRSPDLKGRAKIVPNKDSRIVSVEARAGRDGGEVGHAPNPSAERVYVWARGPPASPSGAGDGHGGVRGALPAQPGRDRRPGREQPGRQRAVPAPGQRGGEHQRMKRSHSSHRAATLGGPRRHVKRVRRDA